MSITFTTPTPATGLRVKCCDGGVRDARVWPSATTYARIDSEHAAACLSDSCGDGGVIEEVYAMEMEPVWVDQYTAPFVLETLGYAVPEDGDMWGSATAADFLGRVLLAEAISPTDEGTPARRALPGEQVGPFLAVEGGAVLHDGGRPAGYLQDVLRRLRALAEVARTHELRITWA